MISEHERVAERPVVILVVGVPGAGKSTVARALAEPSNGQPASRATWCNITSRSPVWSVQVSPRPRSVERRRG